MACPLFLPLLVLLACCLLFAGVGSNNKRIGIATPASSVDNGTLTLASYDGGGRNTIHTSGDITSLLQDTLTLDLPRLSDPSASLPTESTTASPADTLDTSTGETEPLTDGQPEPQAMDEQLNSLDEASRGVDDTTERPYDQFQETPSAGIQGVNDSAQPVDDQFQETPSAGRNATSNLPGSQLTTRPTGTDESSIVQQSSAEEWPLANRNKVLLIVRMTEVLAMAIAVSGLLVYGTARASMQMDHSRDMQARAPAEGVPDMFPPAAVDAEAFSGSPLPEDVHSLLAMALIQDARLADRGAGNLQLRSLQIKADVALLVILILGKVAMLVEVWALVVPHALLDNGLALVSSGINPEMSQTKSYLGPKECSAFGLSQVGFFLLIASFWALTCIGQIRMCWHTFWALIVVTPTAASMADSLAWKGPAPGYRTAADNGVAPRLRLLVGLSPALKATIASVLLLPWLGTSCLLLWLGCRWLAAGDFACLVLRLLALEFLLHLWGLGFSLFVPERSKREFRQVQVPSDRPSVALATRTPQSSKQHGFPWSGFVWAALGLLGTLHCLVSLQRTALLEATTGPAMATPLRGCILRLASVVS